MKKILSIKEFDKLLDELNIQPILKSRLRRVRWLYNNSNKCLMVYEEKLVRLIVHRLEQKIEELRTTRYTKDWIEECIKFRGKVLFGEKAHWCYDWDGLPVDETCEEFKVCTCFRDGHMTKEILEEKMNIGSER